MARIWGGPFVGPQLIANFELHKGGSLELAGSQQGLASGSGSPSPSELPVKLLCGLLKFLA